ncbi:CAP domain-containing protein [Flavobacterium sp. LB1P62]|uniref:CAP domain-containing protein n=1 Tax=unclassified Flavobacterium TaxID=196869 RepID=UPI003AAE16E6
MTSVLFRVLFLSFLFFVISSCSSDNPELPTLAATSYQKIVDYNYNTSEIETLNLINTYRVSIGLNSLGKINYISLKSEEHNNYMIINNVVDHNDFLARSENIMNVLGAKSVSENIAYNYNSSQSVLNAWLASPEHKKNIEGSFTHFGIAIRVNPSTGKKYYTNIFAKI